MATTDPWYRRVRDGLVRFWRSEDSRIAALRDVAVAGGVVLLLLGGIWIYTGQPFPSQAPLVVVESGSMMHGPQGPCLGGSDCSDFGDPSFSRVGTIDPGDLVLVKRIGGADDVETAFGFGGRDGYGAHGDVVVYKDPNRRDPTPVIHRAMLYVQAVPEGCIPNGGSDGCRYVIPETCAQEEFAEFVQARSGTSNWRAYCQGSPEPITLDLKRGGLFLSLTNYPCGTQTCSPFESGFITKGDNNRDEDQQPSYPGQVSTNGITCCPVQAEWIVGKARGEIPWFGLIKLAIYGNSRYGCQNNEPCSDPTGAAQWTLLRATAPYDIWIGLFIAVGVLIAMPVAFDHGLAFVRSRWGRQGPPQEKPGGEAPKVRNGPGPPREEQRPPRPPRL